MMEYVRFLALFIALFALLVASPEGMLVRLGLEHNTLIAGLMAVIIAGLIHNFKLVFAAAVLLLAVGANLSPEAAVTLLGLDRDYLIAGLFAALLAPWVVGHIED
jgi:hypothetical protein